jgi:hypothetical protein
MIRPCPGSLYTTTAQGGTLGFAPQSVTVTTTNLSGVLFTGSLPMTITRYSLSPYTMVGSGVSTTGTVTLNQPAPQGGLTVIRSIGVVAAELRVA